MTLQRLEVAQQHDVSLMRARLLSNATWKREVTHKNLSSGSQNFISLKIFNIVLYVLGLRPSKSLISVFPEISSESWVRQWIYNWQAKFIKKYLAVKPEKDLSSGGEISQNGPCSLHLSWSSFQLPLPSASFLNAESGVEEIKSLHEAR